MHQFDGELPDIVARAKENGVSWLQSICTTMEEFPDILEIATSYNNVFASIGVHPSEVTDKNIVSPEEITDKTAHEKVTSIGETGLDLYWDSTYKDSQIESFRNHIQASRQTGLPVIIHSRGADEETINVINEESEKGQFKGLIHCFSTSEKVAVEALKNGLYISIAGIVTFKNAKELQQISGKIPSDKLLIETDAPYLAPVPNRGKRNEPAYVRHTAEYLANLRGEEFEKLAETTTNNYFELFSKAS
jgi:TatD DNase family protein